MPSISETYDTVGEKIRAEDMEPGRTYAITIGDSEKVDFDDGAKVVIGFRETPKKLVLNKTNAQAIAAMLGDNTDHWAGKRIGIYRTTTQFGGKMVPCIRVCPAPGNTTPPSMTPAAATVMTGAELQRQQQQPAPAAPQNPYAANAAPNDPAGFNAEIRDLQLQGAIDLPF